MDEAFYRHEGLFGKHDLQCSKETDFSLRVLISGSGVDLEAIGMAKTVIKGTIVVADIDRDKRASPLAAIAIQDLKKDCKTVDGYFLVDY